ncbi:hypothetical protein IJJ36_02725 [Candidatus Saccharibacteria bacterium]|nr:hypothetical protein [Candidatus Saccharibacteria bacterium]
MLVSKIKYTYGKSEETVIDDLFDGAFFYLGNGSHANKVKVERVLTDKVIFSIKEKSENLYSMIDFQHFEPVPNEIELKVGEKAQLAINSLHSFSPIEISLLDIHEGGNFQF